MADRRKTDRRTTEKAPGALLYALGVAEGLDWDIIDLMMAQAAKDKAWKNQSSN